MSKLVVNINEENLDLKLVGGKALNLVELKKAGFAVPHALVVTTEADEKMDKVLEEEIFLKLASLKSEKFAVRSSATVEDAKEASFAGQFESFLGVGKENLIEAVKKCWQSKYKQRVTFYCAFKKIPLALVKMAVLIQEMIFAEKGGVIFTCDIFHKRKNIILIEAAKGLGEKVVSGLVNPERITMEKESQKIREKTSPTGEVLQAEEIKQLTAIALKTEQLYHLPQDIEWAIKDNKIYILQTRPITG